MTVSLLRRAILAAAMVVTMVAQPLVAAPAQAAVPGQITIWNPDLIPSRTSIVFNRIQDPADDLQRVHDEVKVRLKNTGSTDVTVNSVSTTGPFSATPPVTLPTVLNPGVYIDVPVRFTATSGRWSTGTLLVRSTPAGGIANTKTAQLSGYLQALSEHGLEPKLFEIVKNLGFTTAMPTSANSRAAYLKFSADEVLTPYWQVLDSTHQVVLTQIGGWRNYPSSSHVWTYQKGSPTVLSLKFTGHKLDAQSILPRSSKGTAGRTGFTPSGTFGFKLESVYSDPTLNSEAPGRRAGCTAAVCSHYVRVWQARDAGNNVIPGSFIMSMDYIGGNFDFQDNVYLIKNVKPAD